MQLVWPDIVNMKQNSQVVFLELLLPHNGELHMHKHFKKSLRELYINKTKWKDKYSVFSNITLFNIVETCKRKEYHPTNSQF